MMGIQVLEEAVHRWAEKGQPLELKHLSKLLLELGEGISAYAKTYSFY